MESIRWLLLLVVLVAVAREGSSTGTTTTTNAPTTTYPYWRTTKAWGTTYPYWRTTKAWGTTYPYWRTTRAWGTTYPYWRTTTARAWGTTYPYWRTTTSRAWGTTYPYWLTTADPASYQTHYGTSGYISDSHNYYSSSRTYYHHIDNPNNYPVVLHFTSLSMSNCFNCSCEYVEIYPRDWPYDTNVQKFCGHSLPNGNGHVYVPNLGTIAFHGEEYSSNSYYAMRYELVGAYTTDYMTTPNYMHYGHTTGGRIGKSKLLQMLLNMQHQLDALSEEAKILYDLAKDNDINDYARRSVHVLAEDTADQSAEPADDDTANQSAGEADQ